MCCVYVDTTYSYIGFVNNLILNKAKPLFLQTVQNAIYKSDAKSLTYFVIAYTRAFLTP